MNLYGEIKRRPSYHKLLKKNKILPGYAVDDGPALHFINDKLDKTVASRQKSRAYYVHCQKGEISETELETIYLKNC